MKGYNMPQNVAANGRAFVLALAFVAVMADQYAIAIDALLALGLAWLGETLILNGLRASGYLLLLFTLVVAWAGFIWLAFAVLLP
jgi:hypothetical protein